MHLVLIDRFHPPSRGGGTGNSTNLYAASIRRNANFDDYYRDKEEEEADTASVSAIWGTQTQNELQSLMNPISDETRGRNRRYYKVNFMAIDTHGTIEFRQHEGTVAHRVICAWADFVLAIVRYGFAAKESEVRHLPREKKPLQDIVGDRVFRRMKE